MKWNHRLLSIFVLLLTVSTSVAAGELPQGWKEWKTQDGRTYYQRPDGVTTWEAPVPPPPVENASTAEPQAQTQPVPSSAVQPVAASRDDSGFLVGLSPTIGYEVNEFETLGGGLQMQFGWRFSERLAAYLNTGLFYARESESVGFASATANIFLVPVVPTLQFNVFKDFFIAAGFGYAFLHGNATVSAFGFSGSGSASSHGFIFQYGMGYDFWLSDVISVAPKIGVDYARIEGSNLIIPNAGANFMFHF